MEDLYQSSYILDSDWLMQELKSTKWTKEENKRFERALAMFDEKTPDRWVKVAAMTGKSVADVMNQYQELVADVSDIEAGLVPIPGYFASSFTLEWTNNRGFDALRRKPASGRSADQERKKGVPWTEEEHRRFLMGLQKHGKGDWRNISRNFVISKTPTQVASHAQKYYLRQLSGGKDKRRPSIHDITTVHLTHSAPLESNKTPFDDSTVLTPMQKPPSTPKILLDYSNDGAVKVLGSTHGNPLMAYPFDIASHSLQLQRGHGAYLGPLNPEFQIQSARYQVHG